MSEQIEKQTISLEIDTRLLAYLHNLAKEYGSRNPQKDSEDYLNQLLEATIVSDTEAMINEDDTWEKLLETHGLSELMHRGHDFLNTIIIENLKVEAKQT